MKKRAKALCTDWTACRALHVYRQNIPTDCSTQSTLLVKPKKGHESLAREAVKRHKVMEILGRGGRRGEACNSREDGSSARGGGGFRGKGGEEISIKRGNRR